MKALEDEEKFSPTKQRDIPSQRFQELSELNLNATPFVPKELSSPLKSEQPHLLTLMSFYSRKSFWYTTIRATFNACQARS